jgi:DMSO reductase family type II enzyme chaperone
MTIIAISDPPATAPHSSGRSETYDLLATAFSFPEAGFYASLQTGEWPRAIDAAFGRLPCRFRKSDLNWDPPGTYDEMQSEYIRLFQIGGRRGPPCPLHEGHFTRDRSQTLKNLIRFYNHFGFRVVECVMPDHLAVELEFVSQLAGTNEPGATRAQRDFLHSHLAWTDELARRVLRAGPHNFYRSLAMLTSRFVAADTRHLRITLEEQFNGRA